MKWTIQAACVLLTSSSASAFLPNAITNNHHRSVLLPPLKSSPPPSLRPPCSLPRRPSPTTNLAAATSDTGDETPATDPIRNDTPPTTQNPTTTAVTPVFDFTGGATASSEEKARSLASFDRIDDAIMGGISLSSLKDAGADEPYASWSGICRTEGGGFCGFRTLPFREALDTAGQDGIYIDCRLASDDEPQRRVWKMTMRTQSKRTTEIVYQAEFNLPSGGTEDRQGGGEDGWSRVKIPFDSFQLVRGPILVPDMPPADVSQGIFQIGVSLSKFVMGVSMTELPDFRPGYFDLQIQSIGFFRGREAVPAGSSTTTATQEADNGGKELTEQTIVPETVSKVEADKNRPVLFKILSPVLKLLFSEQSNRRRTAMKILTEKRGLSRGKAILFGIRSRRKGRGLVPSLGKTLGIIGVDVARAVVMNSLKVVLLYPFRLIFAVIRAIKKALGMEVKKPITG